MTIIFFHALWPTALLGVLLRHWAALSPTIDRWHLLVLVDLRHGIAWRWFPSSWLPTNTLRFPNQKQLCLRWLRPQNQKLHPRLCVRFFMMILLEKKQPTFGSVIFVSLSISWRGFAKWCKSLPSSWPCTTIPQSVSLPSVTTRSGISHILGFHTGRCISLGCSATACAMQCSDVMMNWYSDIQRMWRNYWRSEFDVVMEWCSDLNLETL